MQEDKLKEAFCLFDKDGSGSISAVELKNVLGIGKKFGNEDIWAEIVKEVDQDGNGEIDYNEFKIMMEKLLNEEVQKL